MHVKANEFYFSNILLIAYLVDLDVDPVFSHWFQQFLQGSLRFRQWSQLFL